MYICGQTQSVAFLVDMGMTGTGQPESYFLQFTSSSTSFTGATCNISNPRAQSPPSKTDTTQLQKLTFLLPRYLLLKLFKFFVLELKFCFVMFCKFRHHSEDAFPMKLNI